MKENEFSLLSNLDDKYFKKYIYGKGLAIDSYNLSTSKLGISIRIV